MFSTYCRVKLSKVATPLHRGGTVNRQITKPILWSLTYRPQSMLPAEKRKNWLTRKGPSYNAQYLQRISRKLNLCLSFQKKDP